jgi:hypothetical protein
MVKTLFKLMSENIDKFLHGPTEPLMEMRLWSEEEINEAYNKAILNKDGSIGAFYDLLGVEKE